MTREKAIEQLQYCKGLIKQNGQVYLDERDFSLLDMAIEALQGEANGEDLIIKGAQGIKDGLYNIQNGKLSKYYAKGGIVQAYEIVPSAEAVQGWRTGKPTKGGKYIVTLIGIGDYRFIDIMHYDKPCMPNKEVSGACWYRDDDEWGDVVYGDSDILAWMPLPKPYREDGEA